MVSKEDFKKVWKDSSRESILNQFYYEHYELFRIKKEVREYIMSELITEWDIKNCGHVSGSDLPVEAITPILDILDKEKDNEQR